MVLPDRRRGAAPQESELPRPQDGRLPELRRARVVDWHAGAELDGRALLAAQPARPRHLLRRRDLRDQVRIRRHAGAGRRAAGHAAPPHAAPAEGGRRGRRDPIQGGDHRVGHPHRASEEDLPQRARPQLRRTRGLVALVDGALAQQHADAAAQGVQPPAAPRARGRAAAAADHGERCRPRGRRAGRRLGQDGPAAQAAAAAARGGAQGAHLLADDADAGPDRGLPRPHRAAVRAARRQRGGQGPAGRHRPLPDRRHRDRLRISALDARRWRWDQPHRRRHLHHLRLGLEPAERPSGHGALPPHRADAGGAHLPLHLG